MLGTIGAAENPGVHNEVLGVRGIIQLKIALRWSVANRAGVIAAAVGRANLGAAGIVSHAPVMHGAERLTVVARVAVAGLFWGYNVWGHNKIPRLP